MEAFIVGNMAEARKHVPDELVDDCSVIGTPADCRDKLSELKRAGLTLVALAFQATFDKTMKRIREILQ